MVYRREDHPINRFSAAEWLLMTEKYPSLTKVDIAFVQDSLNHRLSAKIVKDVFDERSCDLSLRGNTPATWLYRIGGFEAVLKAINSLVQITDIVRKPQLAAIARNMIEDDSWLRYPTYGSSYFMYEAILAARDRGRTDVLEEIDKEVKRRTERGIIDYQMRQGMQHLINGYDPLKKPTDKPVYAITDPLEAEREFLKESAKYVDVDIAWEHDYSASMLRPPALYDRAYWLTMRLSELRDISFLKAQIDNSDVGVDVKKEIIRQLALKGEYKFISGYFFATSTGERAIDRSALAGIGDSVDYFLPAYVGAIVESAKQL